MRPPCAVNTLGILLAGLLQAERNADRWQSTCAPVTMMTRQNGRILLIPCRRAVRRKAAPAN
jgi:hypothetical protein